MLTTLEAEVVGFETPVATTAVGRLGDDGIAEQDERALQIADKIAEVGTITQKSAKEAT